MPLRVGIVGVGTIGSLYADVLRRAPAGNLELVATADPDPRRSVPGVPALALPDLLAAVDAVVVATPPHQHAPLAVAALRAGRHVLVEKPPALSLRQLAEMRDAAARTGRVLVAAFHARHGGAVRAAAARLAGERVTALDVTYREDVLRYHAADSWVFDPARAGGGVVLDSGINAVSVVTALAPDAPLRVGRARLEQPADLAVETRAELEFGIGSAGRGHLSLDWRHAGTEVRRFDLATGSGHRLVLDLVRQRLWWDGDLVVAGAERPAVDQAEEYVGVVADFAAAVRDGRGATGEAELAFVEAVYRRAAHEPTLGSGR